MRVGRVSPVVVLGGLLVAQLADAVTFAYALPILGIEAEANAVMRSAYEFGGLAGVLGAKFLAIAVVVGVLAAVSRRFPRLVTMVGATGTTFGVLGATVNMLAVIALTA